MNIVIEVDSNLIKKVIDHDETTVDEPRVKPHVESNIDPHVETFIPTSGEPQANPSSKPTTDNLVFYTYLDNILNEELSDKDPQNEEPNV